MPLDYSALSKKPDPSSRTSSALEANQFANQFGSRGKPVRELVFSNYDVIACRSHSCNVANC